MKCYCTGNGLNKLAILCFFIFYAGITRAADVHRQLGVKWVLLKTNNGKENQVSRLILSNLSKESITCDKWSLWFNFIRQIDEESVDKKFKIEHKNGDLYQLSFVDKQLLIPVGDSIVVTFVTNGRIPNFSDGPSGIYLTYDADHGLKGYPIADFSIVRPTDAIDEQLDKLAKRYHLNNLAANGKAQMTIPAVQSFKAGKGTYVLTHKSRLSVDKAFEKEGIYFRNFIQEMAGVIITPGQNTTINPGIKIKKNQSLAEEEYQLTVDEKGVTIAASTGKGVFYAIQTIKSLLPAASWNIKLQKIEIPFVIITDQPRFAYRGLMVDVARNFQSKAALKRIIDVMAMYKLNTLHLHLNDDEGWRLEIPALPELTEVGSVRNAAFVNGNSLQPAYGSGADGVEKSFYTPSDFIEILRHASENHIEVIPELETPGHARAAIKSMEARYHKFMAAGNPAAANKYLLNDFEDRSEYNSAQNWNDNVMNVGLPATYRFISTVLDELKAVYKSAGLTLKKVHLGGDELPRGAWEKSPKIKALTDSLQLSSVNEVWPYYIEKIAGLCKAKDLELLGWEEMGMLNKGNGMEVNPALAGHGIQLDVWNNLVGDGQEDLAYKLANAGYKVVFTSAHNFYFDLAWADTFEEPGHSWAGFTDLRKAYSFLPANYFLNLSKNNDGEAMASGYFDHKVRLTTAGKENLIGVKAAIWAEKVRDQKRLEYMLFPRVIALAERAWAAEPAWEKGVVFNAEGFEKDYAAFNKKLGSQELQKLNVLNGGYGYRLPAIGIRLYEESFLCNTEYPGFDIFYTTDGTEPDLKSAKYTSPVALNRTKTYKFKVISAKGRGGDTVTIKLNN